MNEIVDSFIEIKLGTEEDFLKVKETLSRIGVASKKEKTLWQSVHILHKQGKFYLVHFKSMFVLDGKESTLTEDDEKRVNTVAKLLEDWGLIQIVDRCRGCLKNLAPMNTIKIIKHSEKNEWNLVSKYTIGKKTRT